MHAFITNTIPNTPHTTIGPTIDDVRQLQHLLSRKSSSNIIVIPEAHLLTIPAQHALLKTLEEPPPNTTIYLVTNFPDTLLPTILSRCQILHSETVIPTVVEESLTLLNQLLAAKVGERLKILDDAKFDRAVALKFLDDLEIIIHTDLFHFHKLFPLVQETRTYLKANCVVKLALDNFALNL